mmetsp:Transcript_91728/g.233301  ORF Transcript_91728/g.233301 Transcript_91728/m.233301 type:complete len:114 (+) Transcript_91728:989-1330(+)
MLLIYVGSDDRYIGTDCCEQNRQECHEAMRLRQPLYSKVPYLALRRSGCIARIVAMLQGVAKCATLFRFPWRLRHASKVCTSSPRVHAGGQRTLARARVAQSLSCTSISDQLA